MTQRESALARCLSEARAECDGLRREIRELLSANANLRVELSAADAIAAEAVALLTEAGSDPPGRQGRD